MSAQTYQVGAHFKALNGAAFMASPKILDELFFKFRPSLPRCDFSKTVSNLDDVESNKFGQELYEDMYLISNQRIKEIGSKKIG